MIFEKISYLVAQLLHFMDSIGYVGLLIITIIESTSIPIMLPSELVLIMAGYRTVNGNADVFISILIATLGATIGALINYLFASLVGRNLLYKYGHFILLSHTKLHHIERLFRRYASAATFIGRFMPFVKHIVSLPAGFAQMPKRPFLIYTVLGSMLFATIMICIGAYMGSHLVFIKQHPFVLPACTMFFSLGLIGIYYYIVKLSAKDI